MNDNELIVQKEYTDAFLTRQGKKILLNILQDPGICSSMLAEKLDIKKNSMSNALERLKSSEYPLVFFQQKGRNKHYYLTEWGELYAKTYLQPPSTTNSSNPFPNTTSLQYSSTKEVQQRISECIEDLMHLSDEWEFDLYDFLQTKTSTPYSEKQQIMSELMQLFQEVFSLEKHQLPSDICELIHSDHLKRQIIHWLQNRCGLIPLWNWAEDSWFDAYCFIDELFSENKLIESYNFIKSYEKYNLPEATFRQIVLNLIELIHTGYQQNLKKTEFYNLIASQTAQYDARLCFYIAEKYANINKPQ